MSEVVAVTNSMLSVDALKHIVTSSYDLGDILEIRFLNFGLNDTYLVKTATLEKQWVRSPIAGLVSEVKVKSVTVKGITLEIVLLEEEVKRDVN